MQHALLAAADVVYKCIDEVLIWRRKQDNNRIGKWDGPYHDEDRDPSKKIVYVRDSPVSPCRPFNLVQVKKYLHSDVAAQTFVFEVFEGLRCMSRVTNACMTEVTAPDDLRLDSVELKEAFRIKVG